MSRRHRPDDQPYSRRSLKRSEHRRVRRQVAQLLSTADDYEDLTLPEALHTVEPSEPPMPDRRDRWRHWKKPFWKRRSGFKAEQADIARRYWTEEAA